VFLTKYSPLINIHRTYRCVSFATMVTRSHNNVTLHENCLS